MVFDRRAKVVSAIVLAVVIIAGGGIIYRDKVVALFQNKSDNVANTSSSTVKEEDKFNYPQSWSIVELTDADKDAGILFKLQHTSPEGNLIIRSIVGDLASEATQDKESLATSISDSLKAGIDGYQLVSKKVEKSGSIDIIRLQYNQTKGDKTYENVMAILPTSKQVFYMTFRAERGDFEKLTSDIDATIQDFAAYVDTKI